MEVRDGFISGIFNYCDRWCEGCAFTSRCRLFADMAEVEASLDSNFKAVAEAPPLPQDVPPDPPPWLQELIDEMNAAASTPVSKQEPEELRPRIPPQHQHIEDRAHAYCDQVHAWLTARDLYSRDPDDPRAVIGWFHTLIPSKIHRALTGLARHLDDIDDWPADYDGSAKVAIVGIERSHAAFLRLVESGIASQPEVAPHVVDLLWLREMLERVFPGARTFVRPAFDEPDEVARLGCADP
jgi:hypothetical protein